MTGASGAGGASTGDNEALTAGLPAVLDMIVVGGGPAGTAAVFRARELGRKALLIEREELLKRFKDCDSEKLLESDDESAGRRRLPKCGELIQALRLSANGKGFDLASAWKELYRRFDVPYRISAELVELRWGYAGTWRVGVFNQRSETREDLYTKSVVLALGRDADRELLERIGVVRDIGGGRNTVLLSTDLESGSRNVYAAGNMLYPAYFECDHFDDDSSRFREVKHAGSIYTSLADGITVADAIAQRWPGRIGVGSTRESLGDAHVSTVSGPAVGSSARGGDPRRQAPGLVAGFAIAIAVSAAVWALVSGNGAVLPADDAVIVNGGSEEPPPGRQGAASSTGSAATEAHSLEALSAESLGAGNEPTAVAAGPAEEPERPAPAPEPRSVDELLAAANNAFAAGEFGTARRLFREARERDGRRVSTVEGSQVQSMSAATRGVVDGAPDVDQGVQRQVGRGEDMRPAAVNDATSLRRAVQTNNVQAVRSWVQRGGDVQTEDENGNTPLHYAALAGTADVLRVLIAAGADAQVSNNRGRTPVDLAKTGAADASIVSELERAAGAGHTGR